MAFRPPESGTRDFVERTRRAIANPPAGSDPWLLDYFGHLATPRGMETYLRATAQMVELAGGVEGRDVLDAGSGFGTLSHLLGSWGARRVYSVEIHAPMAETHRLVREAYFANLAGVVHHVPGDVSTALLPSRSVDLVFSIEAISHYHDVPAFLDQCARVLRPGGVLFVSDGNNGANARIRRDTAGLWKRLELGPHGPCLEHRIDETMLERRVRFIGERYPAIDAATRDRLAAATSGAGPDELAGAIETWLRDGAMPDSPYVEGTCPREPYWGYWVEWLFDPRGLAMEMVNRGFDAKAIPHYGGAANDLVLAANRVLRVVPSFRFARAFRIVAKRRG